MLLLYAKSLGQGIIKDWKEYYKRKWVRFLFVENYKNIDLLKTINGL